MQDYKIHKLIDLRALLNHKIKLQNHIKNSHLMFDNQLMLLVLLLLLLLFFYFVK